MNHVEFLFFFFPSISELLCTWSKCCTYEITSNNRAEEEWCMVLLTMEKKDRFTYIHFFDFSCLVKYFFPLADYSFFSYYGNK